MNKNLLILLPMIVFSLNQAWAGSWPPQSGSPQIRCTGGPFTGDAQHVVLSPQEKRDTWSSEEIEGFTISVTQSNGFAGPTNDITISYKHNPITPKISSTASTFLEMTVGKEDVLCHTVNR